VVLLAVLVNLTPVQNFLARKAASILSDKLKTKVAIQHVRIDFLNHVLVQGLYIEDRAHDTLLYAGEASVRITDWFIFKKDVPVIRYVGLKNAYGHLYRTTANDVWNYQFMVDAFDTGPRDTTKKQNSFKMDLEKVVLENVRFHMDDAWGGSDYDIDVSALLLDANELNLQKKLLDVNVLDVKGLAFYMRDYDVAKGYVKKKKTHEIDTTPFNKANWLIKGNKLSLENCRYVLNTATRPAYVNEFDPSHMDVSDINLLAENILIQADTLTASLKNLSARERCGFVVKKLSADVTVSPNASICDNLYLETNRSKIQHRYAMYYERFPDFEDYVDKVRMSADFRNAIIDNRDIAFFTPVINQFRATVLANGIVNGSVDSLVGKNLKITDGVSRLSGDLTMIGIPDIDNTFFKFSSGEIYTTKDVIFKYFPELRDFRTVDIEKMGFVHYQGSFIGYLESFIANGNLSTALGSVQSDVHMKLPGMNTGKAIYSGTITSKGLDVGALFRQPLFGNIALSVNVEGQAFDPKTASINLNGDVSSLEFNGYTYKDINAVGLLSNKKFDGKLLVNDPNLALAFYGNADFSQPQLQIHATANLLSSNLQQLNFTKDSLTFTSDFDLNYTGNNIDEFVGYAKLYNINLFREGHRLDIDSVYLHSAIAEDKKTLALESNDVSAYLTGDYLLSRLPYSVQYYVSGYLPNYIAAPLQYAPNQVIDFKVETHEMDSLLAVLAPRFKGFNNTVIEGSLNTNTQQLSLKAGIPYGSVYGISFDNAMIDAKGNFNQLSLAAQSDKFSIGKDLVTVSLKANTVLGNDSLSFNIATDSKDDYGTAKIEGRAYASGDSLYLKFEPSEFFLNKYRWEIPSGNRFVLSKNYLFVRDFIMQSGDQMISVNSESEQTDQAINVMIKDFDLKMLGNLVNISEYEPGGKLNGIIAIKDVFRELSLQSDLVASNVMFGKDTIGTVKLAGNYKAEKEIITLLPTSGIFRGNASLQAAGSMSLDSNNNQLLNGYINFNDAHLSWIQPLVSDLLSNMSGTLNGRIDIGGSAKQPDVKGFVNIKDGATKIDVIGTYYHIPEATVKVNNERIDFGEITLYDDYKNSATLTGGMLHDRFRNIRFNRVLVTSPKFEVLNLSEKDNSAFYGNLVANVSSLTITGDVHDIRMNIRATPADKSHIYIPVKSSTDLGSYSYITFKQYGEQQVVTKKKKNKFSLTLTGDMNPLAELTMVLDPATGDLINAKGYGNITLSLPANEDMKMYGTYDIESGDYTFTFRKLFFVRNFKINSGSRINFNGPLENTNLNVNGVYTTKARLADLLNDVEKNQIAGTSESKETNVRQDINILLNMTGSLDEPKLNFSLELPDKRNEGTLAADKLRRINQDYSTLFDQVASLLLVGTFLPTNSSLAAFNTNAAISNNVGQILSSTFSSQLTNMVSKLLNDPSLAIELRYNTYNAGDRSLDNTSGLSNVNRNELSLNIKKNFLKDRLIVELGSAYDWGRPTSTNSSTSNLNLAGDFRAQYLLTEDGRIRLNAFNIRNYDVLINENVYRAGVGISYRRSFDNLREFFGQSARPKMQQLKDSVQHMKPEDTTSTTVSL